MGERIPTDELRRLVDLASPGPWQAEPMTGRGAWIAAADGNWAALSCGETDQLGERNALLIALAPTLAAEVLQLRKDFGKIEAAGLGGYLTPELVADITRAAISQPATTDAAMQRGRK